MSLRELAQRVREAQEELHRIRAEGNASYVEDRTAYDTWWSLKEELARRATSEL